MPRLPKFEQRSISLGGERGANIATSTAGLEQRVKVRDLQKAAQLTSQIVQKRQRAEENNFLASSDSRDISELNKFLEETTLNADESGLGIESAVQQKAFDLRDQSLGRAPSDRAKKRYTDRTGLSMDRIVARARRIERNQQIGFFKSNIDKNIQSSTSNLIKSGDAQEFGTALNKLEEDVQENVGVLYNQQEANDLLSTSKKNLAKGFLSGLEDTNPALGMSILGEKKGSNVFDEIMGTPAKLNAIDRMDAKFRAQQSNQNAAFRNDVNQTNQLAMRKRFSPIETDNYTKKINRSGLEDFEKNNALASFAASQASFEYMDKLKSETDPAIREELFKNPETVFKAEMTESGVKPGSKIEEIARIDFNRKAKSQVAAFQKAIRDDGATTVLSQDKDLLRRIETAETSEERSLHYKELSQKITRLGGDGKSVAPKGEVKASAEIFKTGNGEQVFQEYTRFKNKYGSMSSGAINQVMNEDGVPPVYAYISTVPADQQQSMATAVRNIKSNRDTKALPLGVTDSSVQQQVASSMGDVRTKLLSGSTKGLNRKVVDGMMEMTYALALEKLSTGATTNVSTAVEDAREVVIGNYIVDRDDTFFPRQLPSGVKVNEDRVVNSLRSLKNSPSDIERVLDKKMVIPKRAEVIGTKKGAQIVETEARKEFMERIQSTMFTRPSASDPGSLEMYFIRDDGKYDSIKVLDNGKEVPATIDLEELMDDESALFDRMSGGSAREQRAAEKSGAELEAKSRFVGF